MKKKMKKRLARALAVILAVAMTCSNAWAASFDDLQAAIDGVNDASASYDVGSESSEPGSAGESVESVGTEAGSDTTESDSVSDSAASESGSGSEPAESVGTETGSDTTGSDSVSDSAASESDSASEPAESVGTEAGNDTTGSDSASDSAASDSGSASEPAESVGTEAGNDTIGSDSASDSAASDSGSASEPAESAESDEGSGIPDSNSESAPALSEPESASEPAESAGSDEGSGIPDSNSESAPVSSEPDSASEPAESAGTDEGSSTVESDSGSDSASSESDSASGSSESVESDAGSSTVGSDSGSGSASSEPGSVSESSESAKSYLSSESTESEASKKSVTVAQESHENGTLINGSEDGPKRYGYGWNEELTDSSGGKGWWDIEVWNDEEGTRNIKLNGNVERTNGDTNGTIIIAKNVIINLNGKTIDGKYNGNNKGSIIEVRKEETEEGTKEGTLTINDDSNEGEITGGNNQPTTDDNTTPATAGGIVVNGGNLILNGGSITGNHGQPNWDTNKDSYSAGGVLVRGGGTFIMNGGSVTGNTSGSEGVSGVSVAGSTFVMNGGIISNNTLGNIVLGRQGGVFISHGGSFEMNGGEISGNTASNGGGVGVDNGSFTMNGGEISGNTASSGGGVEVDNNGSFTMNGGKISGNTARNGNGGGVQVNNGSFTMTGGEISGNKAVNKVVIDDVERDTSYGGGIAGLGSKSTITIERGTITKNNAGYAGGGIGGYGNTILKGGIISENDGGGFGGGVHNCGNTVVIEDGTTIIRNNTAHKGGGISLWDSTFFMRGGTVSGNTARTGEGGGIALLNSSIGTITKGHIIGNKTETKVDLGGGGIYISDPATLTLKNALITNNIAATMGGGLAACLRGRTFQYANGAAIFGNTANGDYSEIVNPENPTNPSDGGNVWRKFSEMDLKNFLTAAQDIFAAGFVDSDTDGGSLVGNLMLGVADGLVDSSGKLISTDSLTPEQLVEISESLANWEGYRVMYGENGEKEKILIPIGVGNNGMVYADRFLVLTANPSETGIQAARNSASVIIEGNKSMHTHGGGIANNGVLIMGDKPEGGGEITVDGSSINSTPDTELKKYFTDSNGADRPMNSGEFHFSLEGGLMDQETGEVAENGHKNFDMTNDADGNAVFKFSNDIFTKPGTYVFYLSEVDTGANRVTYDNTRYKITIKVEGIIETTEINYTTYIVKNLAIVDHQIERIIGTDAEGRDITEKVDEITFRNQYTLPDEEPVNPVTPVFPSGSTDSGDSTTEYTTIARTRVPLAEMPAGLVEIGEQEVPLSAMPKLTEILDEDVPLARVPQTGDNVLIWWCLTAISIIGLAWLALDEKRKASDK